MSVRRAETINLMKQGVISNVFNEGESKFGSKHKSKLKTIVYVRPSHPLNLLPSSPHLFSWYTGTRLCFPELADETEFSPGISQNELFLKLTTFFLEFCDVDILLKIGKQILKSIPEKEISSSIFLSRGKILFSYLSENVQNSVFKNSPGVHEHLTMFLYLIHEFFVRVKSQNGRLGYLHTQNEF